MTLSRHTWHIPLHERDLLLCQALETVVEHTGKPLLLRLDSLPGLRDAGLELFDKALDQMQLDCIHILLGRGLHVMDEAFVLGFTLGSIKKLRDSEEQLHALLKRHVYPQIPQFAAQEISVCKDAIRLAYISNCMALDQCEFGAWFNFPLHEIRAAIGIESELLRAYYEVEKRRYPACMASQRLLPPMQSVACQA